jgi:citrate lyase subunit alpha/citrate CoA-transferase
MKNSKLPIKTIEQLKQEAEAICGVPDKPKFTNKPVAVVKWVDGTIIDTIWEVDNS